MSWDGDRSMAKPAASTPLDFVELPVEQMRRRADELATEMQRRRTVREFDHRPIPREIIVACIRAACSAPSGANQQPWRFVAVSDPAIKKRIREAAEAEEREFYGRRASEEWLATLAPLGTDAHKPFLETAPWLIAIFSERFGVDARGRKQKRYYPDESVGIATGMLITALHHAGLATLTHTPSPMKFLNEILGRPKDRERPFLLLVTGYPAPGCHVPDIRRLPFATVTQFMEGLG
jgi:iodotyrosine deiodinase